MNYYKKTFICLGLLSLSSLLLAEKAPKKENTVRVERKYSVLIVYSKVPFPTDISNETQSRAVSRDAAVAQAQQALLTDIMTMKTKSGRPLSVAQVPSLEVQNAIQALLKDMVIKKTTWEKQTCSVVMELDKKNLKKILSSN